MGHQFLINVAKCGLCFNVSIIMIFAFILAIVSAVALVEGDAKPYEPFWLENGYQIIDHGYGHYGYHKREADAHGYGYGHGYHGHHGHGYRPHHRHHGYGYGHRGYHGWAWPRWALRVLL